MLPALTVEDRAQEIIKCFLAAIRGGDWRAAEALLMRVYGKPQEKVEVTIPQSVDDVARLSLEQIQSLRAQLETNGSSSW